MTESSNILLQGGTLLLHEANERVVSRRLDLFIDGNSILKIEENIDVDDQSVKIINCHPVSSIPTITYGKLS